MAFFLVFILSLPSTALAFVGQGKVLFEQKCAACHTIGGGRRVGPDLAGVHDRHKEDWMLKFIKSSQAVIQSGDPEAVALFEQNNKIIMPDHLFSDDEIKGIIAYIKEAGGSSAPHSGGGQVVVETPSEPTPDEILLGRNLFQGRVRFTQGGPSCISCHHVRNDAVIGGGVLAKDLTLVFSRIGKPGVQAILGSPPFPVMQAAYQGKSFTPEEIRALTGFLQDADREHAFQQPKDYGWGLFNAGISGVVLLSVLCALMGWRRKKHSVNQAIYDRQIQSE
ncbi:MAG: cytochrome c [Deltaproteobacteria bacterium]|nr:cytochrome c [Deltaproteobacteria bacterium]